jgi:hypothetical protein
MYKGYGYLSGAETARRVPATPILDIATWNARSGEEGQGVLLPASGELSQLSSLLLL